MRLLFMALVVSLWLLPAAFCCAGPLADVPPLRLTIYLGQVDAPDPQAKIGLAEWSQAFQQRIGVTLYNELIGYYPSRQAHVVAAALPQIPEPARLSALWNEQQAIYVLSAVASRDGDVTHVDSTVFLGGLRGALSSPLLVVHQAVRRKDYQASQGALEALTLYGLAHEVLTQGHASTACAIFRDAARRLSQFDANAMGIAAFPLALRADMRGAGCG